MRWVVIFLVVVLGGCEVMGSVVCAPRYMVELCLQEAWAQSDAEGLGPHCKSLNDWAIAHHWAVSGVGGGGKGHGESTGGLADE